MGSPVPSDPEEERGKVWHEMGTSVYIIGDWEPKGVAVSEAEIVLQQEL